MFTNIAIYIYIYIYAWCIDICIDICIDMLGRDAAEGARRRQGAAPEGGVWGGGAQGEPLV